MKAVGIKAALPKRGEVGRRREQSESKSERQKGRKAERDEERKESGNGVEGEFTIMDVAKA